MMWGDLQRASVTAKPVRCPFQYAMRAGVTAKFHSNAWCNDGMHEQNRTTPSQSASKKWNAKCTRSKALNWKTVTATTPGKCAGTENVPKVLCLPGTNCEAQNRMARMQASMTKRRDCSARRKRLTRKLARPHKSPSLQRFCWTLAT